MSITKLVIAIVVMLLFIGGLACLLYLWEIQNKKIKKYLNKKDNYDETDD